VYAAAHERFIVVRAGARAAVGLQMETSGLLNLRSGFPYAPRPESLYNYGLCSRHLFP
jgi:hypothetical protein